MLNTDAMSVLRILRQAAVNETRILVDTGLYLCGRLYEQKGGTQSWKRSRECAEVNANKGSKRVANVIESLVNS